jgi:hypothetical protein
MVNVVGRIFRQICDVNRSKYELLNFPTWSKTLLMCEMGRRNGGFAPEGTKRKEEKAAGEPL